MAPIIPSTIRTQNTAITIVAKQAAATFFPFATHAAGAAL